MTFVEGASVFSASIPIQTTISGTAASGVLEVTCTGTGNGGEVDCVEEVAVSAPGFASEGATNFLATTSPIFTISGSQVSSSTGTQVSSSTGTQASSTMGTQTASTTGTQAVPTTTAKNSASHNMISLTSTSLLGLIGFSYVIFYNIL